MIENLVQRLPPYQPNAQPAVCFPNILLPRFPPIPAMESWFVGNDSQPDTCIDNLYNIGMVPH